MPNLEDFARGGWIAPALLGVVLGSSLQLQQAALWPWPVYALTAATALAFLGGLSLAGRGATGRGDPLGLTALLRGSIVLLACALLAFGLCGLRATRFAAQALDPALEGRDIAVTGMVAAMPQRHETGLRFHLQVEAATLDGAAVRVPPRLYLGWYGGAMPNPEGRLELQRLAPELRAGERWRMTVRLKAPHGNINPHGFDYELWLWEQGLQATGYVRSGPRDVPPQRLADTWRHPVERARQDVRDAVFLHLAAAPGAGAAERKSAGLIAALAVGDQNAIERSDWDVFRATGVAHLMSISGLHITMFAWAAAWLVGALWRRSQRLCLAWPAQHAALVGGLLLAGGYALFSGWGVPAQRTVWMLATVGLLRMSGRRWPWPHVWLLACAVVATLDPWALLQPGFWLSFVAVGVLFATDVGIPASAARAEGARAVVAHAAGRLLSVLREQWVITLALTPLTLLLFGQVSLVGLLANALAIPWVTLVVTPLALAGVVAAPLWHVAAWAVQALALYLQWLAAFPFATLSAPAPPLWAGVAGVLGGLLLAMRLPWHARLLGLPLLLPVLLWQAPRPAVGQFEVLAADIGQGNAVIVRTAAHTLVYDSGPRYGPESDAGHRVLVPLLRALDEKVDMLVLSHRDSDHTGGAAAVLNMQPRAALLGSIEPGHELQAIRAARRCAAGQAWRWDGVDFEVLHPALSDYAAGAKANAMSCVLRVSNGTGTALLAGDIEQPQEAVLVERSGGAPRTGSVLRADLLLVPHHGSKSSSSEAFLDAVQPALALVQAGYRNRFGHPSPLVVERYRVRGAMLIESPRCGALRWDSAAPARSICQRDLARRYWHHRVS
ncbi:MAG: DNA internalization-related competence protein ComEC/Rec2 [Ramlibacter sp.]|nr:DNA internalization-related competence protein ComEC/Rec2 [Ramlibacter sp.]